ALGPTVAQSRTPTMPAAAFRSSRHSLRAAAEFRTLSFQVGGAGRAGRARHHPMRPRWWREVLHHVIPFRPAHKLREAESRERDAAMHEVAEGLRGLRHHLCSVEELVAQQGTSLAAGLDAAAVARRAAQCGRNVLRPASRLLALRVASWFCSGFNRFNWAAAVVFLLCWKPIGDPPQPGNLALAVVVVLVICLQAMFEAWQQWITSRAMHAITDMLPATTAVVRNGAKAAVAAADLVPGDVVVLHAGDRVPADMRLVDVSVDAMFDRSALSGAAALSPGTTGCTDANYLETLNMAMMGASVTQGRCTGVVVATGDRTVLGSISRLLVSKRAERTILQFEIRRLVNALTTASLAIGVLFVVVWAAWLRRAYPGFMSASDALANGVGVLVTF
ncbi:hypothetical protein IWQ56_005870, partial [Coemansia nantahalensis]